MIERHFQIPFVARLALAEKQIQQNYRPLIAAHKWFARRPGTLFRALILSEFDGQRIEAKLTEDDGTARDRATRIIRLRQMSDQRGREGKPSYQVVACLAGRGFGVRREDMRQMIFHTKGKVFTPKTLDRLVDCSALLGFRTRR